MPRGRIVLAAVALLVLLLAACSELPAPNGSELSAQAAAGDRYVVVFDGAKLPRDAAHRIAAAGGQLVDALPEVGVALASAADAGFADRLAGLAGVRAVGALRVHALPDVHAVDAVPEPHASGPTAADDLYAALGWGIRRVGAPDAWAAGITGSHDTVVAVIDTGIAWNHPDLAPNVVHVGCYAVLTATCSPYPDRHWHGTHVAGTVAAAFGHGRVVGVGPELGLAGYNVFELFPGVGLSASDYAIWSAMLDAAARGFDVINMSLGGYGVMGPDSATWVAWNRVADHVRKQGVTIVASAGNGGADLNGPLFHIPGDVTGILNVAATGIRPGPAYPQAGAYDVRAFYSNYGAPVTLAAPGGDCGLPDSCDAATRPANWFEHLVVSSYVNAAPGCAATASCPVGYLFAAGTSMAAPHVAGAAALVMDEHRRLSPNQVEARLKRTAENLGDRHAFGHGIVDAFGAAR